MDDKLVMMTEMKHLDEQSVMMIAAGRHVSDNDGDAAAGRAVSDDDSS
jgi:hypothetical protein